VNAQEDQDLARNIDSWGVEMTLLEFLGDFILQEKLGVLGT
jgi:hypothetical protein